MLTDSICVLLCSLSFFAAEVCSQSICEFLGVDTANSFTPANHMKLM